MSQNPLITPDWYLFAQALGDGIGYPKAEENKKQLGFSAQELKKLHDELLNDHHKQLSETEKQMILNCLDGALDYVNTDIHTLYDISEEELKEFKQTLEKHWEMSSQYLK